MTDPFRQQVLDYWNNPDIVWMAADTPDVCQPITQPGFYIVPFCTVGCCFPDGPFNTVQAARVWLADNPLDPE